MIVQLTKIKSRHKDLILIFIFIFLASLFRFIHFPQRLHFLGDQATSSLRAFKIWQNKELTLVGIPITSWEYEGHQLRIGSTAYYLQLIPLLLGNFDPTASTFIFTILGIAAIIPLYFGSKKLTNQNKAIIITAIYVLLPNFIKHTTFLWNPNTQLVLAPITIWLMGWYKQQPKHIKLVALGFTLGLMFTLHYQFILVLTSIFLLYCWQFIKLKQSKRILYLFLGILIGFSPVILGELNTQFYNAQTLILFFQHWAEVANVKTSFPIHYFNSIIFFLAVGAAILIPQKMSKHLVLSALIILVIIDCLVYLPVPKSSYNDAGDWHYADETRTSELIASLNPTDFNIVNLAYVDPLADVQKYLLATKYPDIYAQINSSYYENSSLLIIANNNEDLSQAINYEVNTFVPTATQSSPINANHTLYFWQR